MILITEILQLYYIEKQLTYKCKRMKFLAIKPE
jgi:hypothetical protein